MFDFSTTADQTPRKGRLVLMLPLAGYVIFISESIFALPNPTWALLLLLWALSATVLVWGLTKERARWLMDSVERHASKIVVAIIAVVAIVFIVVNILQAQYFALGAHAEDTAYYNQVLWNTLDGNFLSGNVQQERLYNPPVSNDLALHVSPVLIMVLLPIYALFPHYLTLLVLRDLALAAAAWPLFLIARERIGGVAGVAAVMLYFANPAVIAQGSEAFYLLQLAPLPLFWALRAFSREDFGKFLCWMAVAIGVREDVAIAMAGFGLLAVVRGLPFKWWGSSLGIPVIWWGLTTLLIQPAFGRWGNATFDAALAGGSQTPLGIYRNALGDPSWIVDGLREGGRDFLYRLLRSVAFLGVLGPEGLLAAPGLAASIFLARVFTSASDPISRYALLPSCALIGAAVLIVSRISRNYRRDIPIFAASLLILLPSVSLLDGAKDAVQARLVMYTVRNDAAALQDGLERIPYTASVAAPNYALPVLSSRRELYYITYLDMYPNARPNYILLDQNLDRVTANAVLQKRYVVLLETLSLSRDYETIWRRGEYFLLHRTSTNSPIVSIPTRF